MVGGWDQPAPCTEDGPVGGFCAIRSDRWDLVGCQLTPFLRQCKHGVCGNEGCQEGFHAVPEGVYPVRGVRTGEDNVAGVAGAHAAERAGSDVDAARY